MPVPVGNDGVIFHRGTTNPEQQPQKPYLSGMWKLYITGLTVLLTAILANVLATQLHLLSWYDFLTLLGKEGSAGWRQVRWQDALWLFLVYPLLLGAGALGGLYLQQLLLKLF